MKPLRDPNDNTATRFIAFIVVLLILVAAIAVIQSISFASNTHRHMSTGEFTNYSVGAGLCLLAAALALGLALLAIVKLISD